MIHAKKTTLPLTVIGEEGSAKRNIIRKGGLAKARKESAPGMHVLLAFRNRKNVIAVITIRIGRLCNGRWINFS